jgi:hypothetical protein
MPVGVDAKSNINSQVHPTCIYVHVIMCTYMCAHVCVCVCDEMKERVLGGKINKEITGQRSLVRSSYETLYF